MEALINKSYKTYNILNRYESVPYYFNTLDQKYIYGLTSHINKNLSCVEETIHDYSTLENIAYKYYGKSYYYWVIADYNNIRDPFEKLYPKYKTLLVPTISAITFAS